METTHASRLSYVLLTAGAVAAIAALDVVATANAHAADAHAARGKYLVHIMACSDCHTPMKMGANGPEPDMARFLSGHPESATLPPPPAAKGPWIWSGDATNTAFAGPWGISYAANLTPDRNTGLGIWTEDMFVRAVRTGRHMGGNGRPILPPMPWPNLAQQTDDDLKAIFAYLRQIPAVKNKVPDPLPPAQ
jgi:cytochrome c553